MSASRVDRTESTHVHIAGGDHTVLATLTDGLDGAGYATSRSESMESCLASVKTGCPDLAVVDMTLPGRSSLELARALASDLDTPFVFLTEFADTALTEEAVAVGGLGFLPKPINISYAIPAIESALARSRDIKALQNAYDHLSAVLEKGREISVAVGLMMERHHISHDTAFGELRQSARSQRRSLEDIASQMLLSSETLNLNRHSPVSSK